MTPAEQAALHAHHRALLERHFDAAYYLACHPDIRLANADPLDHFLEQGWREGRNPTRFFDVAYYLAANDDIVRHGINPFVHYVLNGVHEGRPPRRPLHRERQSLEGFTSIRDKARQWAGAADWSEPRPPSDLRSALPNGPGWNIAVSFSHDDYMNSCGGVQHLIADEQQAFADAGWHYLHCSPAVPMPMLADPVAPAALRLRLRLDSVPLGIFWFQDLQDAIAAWREEGRSPQLIVHHLMGHVPELLADASDAAGGRPVVWVHDYFTLCPSYALMRNDVKYCAAPDSASAACQICGYGPDRPGHESRVRAFFERTIPWVLAPSQAALAIWLARGALPYAGVSPVPPARLFLHDMPAETGIVLSGKARLLRVAHIGARLLHKGWHVFETLAHRLSHDQRYQFYHLGFDEGDLLPGCIRNVPVRVTSGDRHAMIDAIAEHRIDVVISWSLWPESFCFAVHEALAGGAFVVARTDAGNVWPAVQANAPERGVPVADEAALAALFTSGDIQTHVARSRRSGGALVSGGNSADWLGARGILANPTPTRPMSAANGVAA